MGKTKVQWSAVIGIILLAGQTHAQTIHDSMVREVLKQHREFVSIPNIASNHDDMMRNYAWVRPLFEDLDFEVDLLPSGTLPVFFAEKNQPGVERTLLIYLHIDGQAVAPENWDQEDPFVPVLKEQDAAGQWTELPWDAIDGAIDDDWRVFGRAAADDKAPIMMLLTALRTMKDSGTSLTSNIKVILDPQEEAGSEAFLSTLEQYRDRYSADYLLIMDGPAHPSNRPTLTLGCRGIATCTITAFGAKLPQHSGHYGNYVPNPIFTMGRILSSMKGDDGRVLIDGYYDGIEMTPELKKLLGKVPDDNKEITKGLLIAKSESVGDNYQESLQYPTLNVRHIETSWKGPGLKTVIPEYVTAHIDVRLVMETDATVQVEKIRQHLISEGYYVIDRDPTDEERLQHETIVRFDAGRGVNAFRTDPDSDIVNTLSLAISNAFGIPPVKIRTMGGTVPIIEAVRVLGINAIIVPMVNMDNNQHNPNENIRVGNIRDGISICRSILTMN